MDPGKIAAQTLRAGSSTGKVRKISYVHNNTISQERNETPKAGQPVLCKEMRDHISILPSTSHKGRAFVRGMEYLLADKPAGAHIRPHRAIFSITENPKSSSDTHRGLHLPQAATLCNVGDEYIRPDIKTRVPRPVSVRVLSRCTLGEEKQYGTGQVKVNNNNSLLTSFLKQRNIDGNSLDTQKEHRTKQYGLRARSSGDNALRNLLGQYSIETGHVTTTLESLSSRVFDDSMDLTIYRDPCSIAREVASVKNNQAVTSTEAETAGELHRLHESYIKSSLSPNNPSTNSEMHREYRRPPIIDLKFATVSSANVSRNIPVKIISATTNATNAIECSQSPPPIFSKASSGLVTPKGHSLVSTKDGTSGLHPSALGSATLSFNTIASIAGMYPPTEQSRRTHIASVSADFHRDYHGSLLDAASCGSKHHSATTDSSIHNCDRESDLHDSSIDPYGMAPESLLPGLPSSLPLQDNDHPHDTSYSIREHPAKQLPNDILNLQRRDLQTVDMTPNRYASSLALPPYAVEGEIDMFSSTAPGVTLPAMSGAIQAGISSAASNRTSASPSLAPNTQTQDYTTETLPPFMDSHTPVRTSKIRSFSAQLSTAPRKKYNIINDSAVPACTIIRPSSRKQITKPQDVVLGPAQRRAPVATADRWKANLN